MTDFGLGDDDLTALKGKVIIVTGGSSGIGLATVELLLSVGASVVCGDVQTPRKDFKGAFKFVKTDVTKWEDLIMLFNEAKEAHGRVDHVFANAGIGPRADYLSTQLDPNGNLIEPSNMNLDVNLKGVINTSTLAIYHLRQRSEGGSIVITGSATGLQRFRAVDYATGKHGVLGFGRGLVPLLEEFQPPIRINTLVPSWTDSDVLPSLKSQLNDINIKVQPASVVARCAASLMADTSMNGRVVHVQRGKYTEVDEAILLPAYERINGDDDPSEDEVLKRLMEAAPAASAPISMTSFWTSNGCRVFPPQPDSGMKGWTSSEPSSSGYQPSLPHPTDFPTGDSQVPIRPRADYLDEAAGRKRGFSEVASSSPPPRRVALQLRVGNGQGSQPQCRDAPLCTQRYPEGPQPGGTLDERCPNVLPHRQGGTDVEHAITAGELVTLLKAQLDANIDRCSPFGNRGGYCAPFKLVCTTYGYTVVGKGTTSELWKQVSQEAQAYQILRKAQGSAVPVFLGTIDLAKIYFLHGAGEIRHMLVMGRGGESIASMELVPWLLREIHKSNEEIRALGFYHEDFRRDNALWNEELGRALIIDFHRCTLKYQLRLKPSRSANRSMKRPLDWTESGDVKRLRVP
ncbi:(-)-trans-carveol dehydrogenase [Fusarium albosuccineum]|uniref:(-)-trans-carveol dehydrogenase n=1 Tax=Fusarium albosuccineum TaxID=1237068 RepID=A0A8H4LHD2_9HYPO|nr:(-)-trans-carveol dehydrogenase [Fusarium albosuccineum]